MAGNNGHGQYKNIQKYDPRSGHKCLRYRDLIRPKRHQVNQVHPLDSGHCIVGMSQGTQNIGSWSGSICSLKTAQDRHLFSIRIRELSGGLLRIICTSSPSKSPQSNIHLAAEENPWEDQRSTLGTITLLPRISMLLRVRVQAHA